MRATQQTIAVAGLLCHGPSYGYDIAQETGIKSGTVYPILRRMERAGYVTSEWDLRGINPTGPPRRVYRLTKAGQVWEITNRKRLQRLVG